MSLDSDFAWISFKPSMVPENYKISYSIKKPLLAASCVLSAVASAADSPDRLLAAEIKAKVPLKGAFHFVAQSAGLEHDGAGIRFLWNSEKNLDSGTESRWDLQDGRLRYSVHSRDGVQESRSGFSSWSDSLSTLTPVQILPALTQSLKSGHRFYGAQIVVGNKFAALHFSRKSEDLKSNLEKFEVRYATYVQPVDESFWSRIDWQSQKSVEFLWNPQELCVEKIMVSIGLWGTVDLNRDPI